MRKTALMVVTLIALAAFLTGDVLAYSPHGTAYVFDFDNGAKTYDYYYIDSYYGTPLFRAYEPSYYQDIYYGEKDDYYCRYWDSSDLKWRRDRVCEWTNRGDFKERTLRARAVGFIDSSFNNRYFSNQGKSSGSAFDYEFEFSEKTSDWGNKEAYSPFVHGPEGNYYYEPRYDYTSGTWNWRY